jgi:signal peptidase I
MASYIPQVTDYIPEFQPFQPDYNFLNNVLQKKQGQYDTNYKALSQTYGTLLNSPMMRQDNIQKRNEYFKLIDQDIKKISGLDLSLQQNVESANSVFDSFSQNKDLVQDIVYTKKYNQQLENAESFKLNCGDPTKCDGQYWDTGVNALKLRAEEYMKAGKEEAMKMSPGEYVPYINVPQKAVSYLNGLLSKGGDNGFGLSGVIMSSNGMYQMTMKNGSLIAVSYKDLLLNVFASDPMIQDMYETQSYVKRKTWIKTRAQELGGDEIKAEDEYFSTVDSFITESRIKAEKAREDEINKKNRQNILAKTIKNKGTTGDDGLSNDYVAASLDVALSTAAKRHAEKSEGIANSIFFVGDNRDAKRQRVDAITANSLMVKEIGDSAIRAALLTGGVTKIEADPYVKAKFDADLSRRNTLDNTQLTADLARRNEREKQIFDFTIKQMEVQNKARGSAFSGGNTATIEDQNIGTSGAVNKLDEINTFVKAGTGVAPLKSEYIKGYTQQLIGIVSNSKDPAEVSFAKQTLKNIYKENYDIGRGDFVDEKGRKIDDYILLLNNAEKGEANTTKFFANAQNEAKLNSNIPSHGEFVKGEGQKILGEYAVHNDLYELGNAEWRKNNKIVKREALESGISNARVNLGWSIYFRNDGSNLTKSEFVDRYKGEVKGALGTDISNSDAEAVYYDVAKLYRQTYNNSKNTESVYNLPGLSKKAGYVNSMKQITYDIIPGQVAGDGMRGFISAKNASDQDPFTKYGFGIAGEEGDLSKDNSALAQQAINAFTNAINTASTDEELEQKMGRVSYQSIGLSNPEYQRVTVKFNQDFIKDNKGQGTTKTWADVPQIVDGVSFYIKNKNHTFAKATAHRPIDVLLAHKDLTVEVPKGGRITLSKMDEDGVIHASGVLNKVVDGKLVEDDPIYNFPYPASKSGESLYQGWEYYLNEIAKRNAAAIKNKTYIMNPNDVLKYQQVFGSEAEQDPTEALLAKFESNMKAFGIGQ